MIKVSNDISAITQISKREFKNKKRWKEIHHLWDILCQPELSRWSIENAMCKYGDDQNVSIEHFMVVVIGEFGYDEAKKIEHCLRKIHGLFETDQNSISDWRQIYGSLKIIKLYRLIKSRPIDLLIQIFDIFSKENIAINAAAINSKTNTTKKSSNQTSNNSSKAMTNNLNTNNLTTDYASTYNNATNNNSSTNRDLWYLYSNSKALRGIFMIPVILVQDEMLILEEFQTAVISLATSMWNRSNNNAISDSNAIESDAYADFFDNNCDELNNSIRTNKFLGNGLHKSTSYNNNDDADGDCDDIFDNDKYIDSTFLPSKATAASPSTRATVAELRSAARLARLNQSKSKLKSSSLPATPETALQSSLTATTSPSAVPLTTTLTSSTSTRVTPFKITRKMFQKMLESDTGTVLVDHWSRLCFLNALPSEIKLSYYHDEENKAVQQMDQLFLSHLIHQAKYLYKHKSYKRVLRKLLDFRNRAVALRLHLGKRMYKKVLLYLRFWSWFAKKEGGRKRRKILANLISAYSRKARYFGRLKLNVYTNKKIHKVVGYMSNRSMNVAQGISHLRQFERLFDMRINFHKWHAIISYQQKHEIANRHNYKRRMLPILHSWHNFTQIEIERRRQEVIAEENRTHFHRVMAETELAVNEMLEIQNLRAREKKVKEEEELRIANEIKAKLVKEQEEARKEEKLYMLHILQRELRRKRVEKELATMKRIFDTKYEAIKVEMIETAKIKIKSFLRSKASKITIEARFNKLKAEFYAPPTPESQEKEKLMTSYKNIIFAHLEVKLKSAGIKIQKAIEEYDKEKKGYLSYDQFEELIASFQLKFTPVQMNSILRAADEDGDGYIDIKEIQHGLVQSRALALPGSPWKLYVDPVQDVMCYHNIEKGEKILEYNMTNEKLKEIFKDNLYAVAVFEAKEQYKILRQTNWEETLNNYYAKRLQTMFKAWKVAKELKIKVELQKRKKDRKSRQQGKWLIETLGKCFYAMKVRRRFHVQLHLSIEKVWDVNEQRIFWYNHVTQQSTWEKPLLLIRYGDVTTPTPWIPLDVSVPVVDVVNSGSSMNGSTSVISDGASATSAAGMNNGGNNYDSTLNMSAISNDTSTSIVHQQQHVHGSSINSSIIFNNNSGDNNSSTMSAIPDTATNAKKDTALPTNSSSKHVNNNNNNDINNISTSDENSVTESVDTSNLRLLTTIDDQSSVILTADDNNILNNTPAAYQSQTSFSSSSSSSSDVVTTPAYIQQIHYWHVKAQTQLPRKPDGLPLCGYCQRNLAIHTCLQCQAHFCFPCHRHTHQSPTGFHQNTSASPLSVDISSSQYHEFVTQQHYSTHRWIDTKTIKCEVCNSNKICAGIYCNQCTKAYCRPCSRRFHAAQATKSHTLYFI